MATNALYPINPYHISYEICYLKIQSVFLTEWSHITPLTLTLLNTACISDFDFSGLFTHTAQACWDRYFPNLFVFCTFQAKRVYATSCRLRCAPSMTCLPEKRKLKTYLFRKKTYDLENLVIKSDYTV